MDLTDLMDLMGRITGSPTIGKTRGCGGSWITMDYHGEKKQISDVTFLLIFETVCFSTPSSGCVPLTQDEIHFV